MNQPQYESDKDRFAEKKFADRMSVTGARLVKLKKNYIVDFAIERNGHVIGFIEYKRRDVMSLQYPTIILALSKWIALCDYAKHGKAFFYVEYNDCTKHIKITPDYIDLNMIGAWLEISGRTDRGDQYDQEPCVHIPNRCLI